MPKLVPDQRRAVVGAVAVVALLVSVVAVRSVTRDDGQPRTASEVATGRDAAAADALGNESSVDVTTASSATADAPGRVPAATTGRTSGGATSAVDGPPLKGAPTALPGVTDKEITVVYYWKGDRTRTSP